MARRQTKQLVRTARGLALGLVLVSVGSMVFVYVRWRYREQRYNQLIEEIAPRTGVDKYLIKAVMRRESGFDPFAYSARGAIGLMQVTPVAGADWARAVHRRDYGTDSLWDPRINLEAGAWYLGRALRRWQQMDDPLPFALAEYNAGPANVQRWLSRAEPQNAQGFLEAIDYRGVRHYIDIVTESYMDYQKRGKL